MLFSNQDVLTFLKYISNETVDFILTDPPYFINEEISIIIRNKKSKYKGKNIDFQKGTQRDRQRKNKNEYRNWMYKIIKEFYRILKQDKHLIMFCDKRDANYFQDYGEQLGFKVRQLLIREKSNPVPRARGVSPMTTFEIMVWLTKGKAKKDFYNRELGMLKDIINCPIPRKEGLPERHPTQKPFFIIMLLILFFSKEKDIVLDPFAGSGTIPISAEILGRQGIYNDQNKKYFELVTEKYFDRYNYGKKIAIKKIIPFIKSIGNSYTVDKIKLLEEIIFTK